MVISRPCPNVKAPALVADCPSEFLTLTFTVPAASAGVVAWICVALLTRTFGEAIAPKRTDAPALKFEPLIVTSVPPAVGPELGLTALMAGAGAGETVSVSEAEAACCDAAESFACTLKVEDPALEGVPLIAPEEDNESPAGREPDEMLHA